VPKTHANKLQFKKENSYAKKKKINTLKLPLRSQLEESVVIQPTDGVFPTKLELS